MVHLFILALIIFLPTSVLAGELVTLDTRPGVTQEFLLMEPKGEPEAIVLMFPGHEGVVRFDRSKDGYFAETDRGGFTASEETRRTYVENGLVVALIAPPSDMQHGMDTRFRSSREHLTDVSAVINYLKERYQKSPYLHGHCRSSFSPASVATKLNNKGLSGIILSSPRSSGRHGAVTDYQEGVITLPILLIQHRDDPCGGTQYLNLKVVKRFYEASAEKVDVIVVSGGYMRQLGTSSKCQHGAHSFVGLQKETANEVVNWIKGNDFQTRISD